MLLLGSQHLEPLVLDNPPNLVQQLRPSRRPRRPRRQTQERLHLVNKEIRLRPSARISLKAINPHLLANKLRRIKHQRSDNQVKQINHQRSDNSDQAVNPRPSANSQQRNNLSQTPLQAQAHLKPQRPGPQRLENRPLLLSPKHSPSNNRQQTQTLSPKHSHNNNPPQIQTPSAQGPRVPPQPHRPSRKHSSHL
jgi:hypothetical protein